ncbi:MAG: dCMP deaminase family protein [Chitinivibrionales bacterium]|nr:dCMP deaminase family protein [Chitinivibrionales bacterium]
MGKANQEKRNDYISWDEYFMGVALLSAMRSKDPNTQVGACIVGDNKRIIGVGYNGFPVGCSDDALPWGREGSFLKTKYPYVCHAELNAVLNTICSTLQNSTLYTVLFPCHECAKVIIQSGIRHVVYLQDKYAETDSVKASKILFDQCGIICRQLVIHREPVVIDWRQP